MKAVFDSSSIFEAILQGKIHILSEGVTTPLAYYELGNILWKSVRFHGDISEMEALKLWKLIVKTLNLMQIIDVKGGEEEALKISIKLELTFYDSAYVNLAKTKNIPLITEDGKLRRKAEKIVETHSVNEL